MIAKNLIPENNQIRDSARYYSIWVNLSEYDCKWIQFSKVYRHLRWASNYWMDESYGRSEDWHAIRELGDTSSVSLQSLYSIAIYFATHYRH